MPPKKTDNPKFVRGKYTDGVRESVNKYNSTHYDKITLRVPKGQSEKLRAIAKKHNLSLNSMYKTALMRYLNEVDKDAYESLLADGNDTE